MQSSAKTPSAYLDALPEERKQVIMKIREVLLNNLPEGFEEGMDYGMLSYHVPHSLYAPGYHVDSKHPLPFINLASQKNHIGFYHMGLYSQPELLQWFQEEYPKHCSRKLDMGKSCVRFKKMEDIPYDLLGELASKMTVEEWIKVYESNIKS